MMMTRAAHDDDDDVSCLGMRAAEGEENKILLGIYPPYLVKYVSRIITSLYYLQTTLPSIPSSAYLFVSCLFSSLVS